MLGRTLRPHEINSRVRDNRSRVRETLQHYPACSLEVALTETTEPTFTELALRRYDGDSGPMYIAYQGVVYDVTDCPHWRRGIHQDLHFPGQDLTAELAQAPHSVEVFAHPCARRVGVLAAG